MTAAQIAEGRKALLAEQRARMLPLPSLFGRAIKYGVPFSLLFAAAGAGLAAYHRSIGRTDFDAEAYYAGAGLDDFVAGYNAEMLSAQISGEGR